MDDQCEGKIVEMCKLLLTNQIDFVVGCRNILALANKLDLPRDLDLTPFVAFTSETDEYPAPDIRDRFNKNFLDQIDGEIADYVSRCRPRIICACTNLIKRFDQPTS